MNKKFLFIMSIAGMFNLSTALAVCPEGSKGHLTIQNNSSKAIYISFGKGKFASWTIPGVVGEVFPHQTKTFSFCATTIENWEVPLNINTTGMNSAPTFYTQIGSLAAMNGLQTACSTSISPLFGIGWSIPSQANPAIKLQNCNVIFNQNLYGTVAFK